MTTQKQYELWKAKNDAVACQFARFIGRNPLRFGQAVKTLNASASPKIVATALDRYIKSQIADPNVTAVAIILPGITSFEQLLFALIELGKKPGWALDATPISTPHLGEFVAYALKREIPFKGGTTMPSEVLVFGDFAHFPATRRAPVVALEMFVGVPSDFDPKTGDPSTKANLAHINMPAITQETMDNLWAKTELARLASLGGINDPRAKAKVSFVAPVAAANTSEEES